MTNPSLVRAIVLFACAVSFHTAARADFVTISLDNFVNRDLNMTFTDGYNYPGEGPITVDGVPFVLSGSGLYNDAAVALTFSALPQTFSIPINLSGVTSVDALVNSTWGACGVTVGEIDFVGSASTYVYNLTEGDNIRDHFNGSFCNTAPGVTATANFGPDRLDLDAITLPAAFANQTLESVQFVGYGLGFEGTPFLAGLTVDPEPSPTPEPSTLLFLGAGAIAILVQQRRSVKHRLH